MSQYANLTKPQLNAAIAERKGEQAQEWANSLELALGLLQDVCTPPKSSTLPRALDIMVETREGSPWYDLSNIFAQEDNGEYTLLQGWNEKNSPPIWFEGTDLAPLCCLAWLTATAPQEERDKQPTMKEQPVYDGLFKIATQKKVEAIIESLHAGLNERGHEIDQTVIEEIVKETLERIVAPE